MEITEGAQESAILEDFTEQAGNLLVVDSKEVRLDLPKSLEPTSQDPRTLYLGHTLDEIKNSASDLLGDQLLSRADDPEYDEVASVFPPIRTIRTYSFLGTNQNYGRSWFCLRPSLPQR